MRHPPKEMHALPICILNFRAQLICKYLLSCFSIRGTGSIAQPLAAKHLNMSYRSFALLLRQSPHKHMICPVWFKIPVNEFNHRILNRQGLTVANLQHRIRGCSDLACVIAIMGNRDMVAKTEGKGAGLKFLLG